MSMCITALLLADARAPRMGPDAWMLFGGQGAVQAPGVLETKEMTLFGYAHELEVPLRLPSCCAPFLMIDWHCAANAASLLMWMPTSHWASVPRPLLQSHMWATSCPLPPARASVCMPRG